LSEVIASCHRAPHLAYCDAIPSVVRRAADVIGAVDPDNRVPTCPDWSVGNLAEHIGSIHRWAGAMVEVLSPDRIRPSALDLGVPEDARALPAWISDGIPVLAARLRSKDPDAPMWAWGADKHVWFWSRRMVHETTVHRADAEFAAGVEPSIEASVAVDGIDEFLENLPHAAYFAPHVTELRGSGERLQFGATDADVRWTVTLEGEGFRWDHEAGEVDASVEAPAADLYLWIWGRRRIHDPDRFAITGDRALLEFWIERSSL